MNQSAAAPKTHPLVIGQQVHDFTADSTAGEIRFHDWIRGSWVLFTTHPTPFTPVCSTELIAEARHVPALRERGVKAITLAAGTVEVQNQWARELSEHSGVTIDFPIIADADFAVAAKFGFLADPGSDVNLARSAIVIDPTGTVRWTVTYPPRTGRNFAEVLRVIDSILLTSREGLASPAEWVPGDPLLVPPSLTTAAAANRFGAVDVALPYLRTVRV